MLTKRLNLASEIFLYILLFGITFSNAAVEGAVIFITLIFFTKLALALFKPQNEAAKLHLKTPVNIFIALLFIVIIISFLRSDCFRCSLKGLFRTIKYIVLYFALTDLFAEENSSRLKRVFWGILFIAGFTFLNGIFQDIFGFDFIRQHTIDQLDYLHRINGSFVHANDFGAYIILVLPLTFIFLSGRFSKTSRAAALLICALGLYCLLRTSSRGAWLGFVIGAVIYFIYYKKKFSLVIPLAMLSLIIVFPAGLKRVLSIFSFQQNTVWERLKLWQGTWDMVKEHPILGFGINTFSEYFPKFKPVDYPDLKYTHNSYLQMWSEIGLIGLIIFLALIITVVIFALRKNKEKMNIRPADGQILLGFACGYIAFLIHAAFDTNLYSLVLLTSFWVYSAYTLSLNKYLEIKCKKTTL